MGIKFGIGRATTDASQEIRSGDITRDEGVLLINLIMNIQIDLQEMKYLSISNKRISSSV